MGLCRSWYVTLNRDLRPIVKGAQARFGGCLWCGPRMGGVGLRGGVGGRNVFPRCPGETRRARTAVEWLVCGVFWLGGLGFHSSWCCGSRGTDLTGWAWFGKL